MVPTKIATARAENRDEHPGGTVIPAIKLFGAPCAYQCGQAGEEKETEQRQHASRGCFAHGSAFPASQPDGPRSLLPQNRPTKGRRYRRVRYRPKLATLIFRLLRWGQSYVDEGAEAYEDRYRQMRIGRLKATAQQLGYELAPINA